MCLVLVFCLHFYYPFIFPSPFFSLCSFVPTTILTTKINNTKKKLQLQPPCESHLEKKSNIYTEPTRKWLIQSNDNPLLESTPTLQSEPSAPPQEVKCSSQGSTNILVSWQPPPTELQNGIITKYAVQYSATEGEDTATRQISDIPPETTQYLLENLEKWTEYRVTVTAHTDVGPGPESLPQLIRTEEDGMCRSPACPLCQPAPSANLPQLLFQIQLTALNPLSLPVLCPTQHLPQQTPLLT